MKILQLFIIASLSVKVTVGKLVREVSFHEFPSQDELKEKWLKAVSSRFYSQF